MNEKLMEFLNNPVMCRMLIEIQEQKQTTAKKLTKLCSDIPQATLYRHLNKMLENGILKVVEEKRIRGTIEKVYALNLPLEINKEDMLKENAGREYFKIFTQFSMGLMKEFQEYTEKDNINILEDGSGFWSIPLYLSKKELKDVASKIQDILDPLFLNKPNSYRKLHSISVIITPPKSNEE